MSFPTAPTLAPSRRRRWPWIVGAMLVLILGLGGLLFSLEGRRMHLAIELKKQATEKYRDLQQAFPFTPPAAQATESADATRLRQALDVRRKLQERLSPGLRNSLNEAMQLNRLSEAAYKIPSWLAQVDSVSKVLEANQADLRAAQMSPAEFSWLIGGLVARALKDSREGRTASPAHAAGEQYWRVLRQAAKLTAQTESPLSEQEYFSLLIGQYGGEPAMPDWALSHLQASDPSLYAVDLLIAGGMLVDWADAQVPPSGNVP
jgi:hypothetical protein